jgi:hypothetical protein
MGEPDPDAHAPMTLTGERLAEAGRLLQQTSRNTGVFVTTDEGTFRVPEEGDEEKETPTYEQVFQGRTFIFEKHTFTLSDGTQVAWSSGRLPEDRPSRASGAAINEKPLPKDLQEWAALQKHGKGQLIGVDELTANGELDRRVFVYQYLLSDGRTMDMREGDELNFAINSEQRKEWVQLKDASSGEDFGTYEKEVQGCMFVFKRQRFVLSDGTELIWSYGTLKDDQ